MQNTRRWDRIFFGIDGGTVAEQVRMLRWRDLSELRDRTLEHLKPVLFYKTIYP